MRHAMRLAWADEDTRTRRGHEDTWADEDTDSEDADDQQTEYDPTEAGDEHQPDADAMSTSTDARSLARLDAMLEKSLIL